MGQVRHRHAKSLSTDRVLAQCTFESRYGHSIRIGAIILNSRSVIDDICQRHEHHRSDLSVLSRTEADDSSRGHEVETKVTHRCHREGSRHRGVLTKYCSTIVERLGAISFVSAAIVTSDVIVGTDGCQQCRILIRAAVNEFRFGAIAGVTSTGNNSAATRKSVANATAAECTVQQESGSAAEKFVVVFAVIVGAVIENSGCHS